MLDQQLDPHGWAKKPRSHKAFELLLGLVNEREPAFIEIMIKLKRDGRTDGVNLFQRWDYISQSWTKA